MMKYRLTFWGLTGYDYKGFHTRNSQTHVRKNLSLDWRFFLRMPGRSGGLLITLLLLTYLVIVSSAVVTVFFQLSANENITHHLS